jgi:hypothetical protein
MNPLRWSGEVRNCQPTGPISLNLMKESIKKTRKKQLNKIWVKNGNYLEKHRKYV